MRQHSYQIELKSPSEAEIFFFAKKGSTILKIGQGGMMAQYTLFVAGPVWVAALVEILEDGGLSKMYASALTFLNNVKMESVLTTPQVVFSAFDVWIEPPHFSGSLALSAFFAGLQDSYSKHNQKLQVGTDCSEKAHFEALLYARQKAHVATR